MNWRKAILCLQYNTCSNQYKFHCSKCVCILAFCFLDFLKSKVNNNHSNISANLLTDTFFRVQGLKRPLNALTPRNGSAFQHNCSTCFNNVAEQRQYIDIRQWSLDTLLKYACLIGDAPWKRSINPGLGYSWTGRALPRFSNSCNQSLEGSVA